MNEYEALRMTIEGLILENQKLKKSVAEATEILTSMLKEIKVNEPEIIKP